MSVDQFPAYSDCWEQLDSLAKKSEALLSKNPFKRTPTDLKRFETIRINYLYFTESSTPLIDFAYATGSNELDDNATSVHSVEVYVAKCEERIQAKKFLSEKLKEGKTLLFLIADSEKEETTVGDDIVLCRTTKADLFSDIDNTLERYAFRKIKPLAEDLWGTEQKYLTGHSYNLRKRLTGASVRDLDM